MKPLIISCVALAFAANCTHAFSVSGGRTTVAYGASVIVSDPGDTDVGVLVDTTLRTTGLHEISIWVSIFSADGELPASLGNGTYSDTIVASSGEQPSQPGPTCLYRLAVQTDGVNGTDNVLTIDLASVVSSAAPVSSSSPVAFGAVAIASIPEPHESAAYLSGPIGDCCYHLG